MKVHETIASFRAALRRGSGTAGFVPTMGYLHNGHRSLIDAARRDCGPEGTVAVSIFVNPLQFGPSEDLAAYPRDLDRDLAVCEAAGVDHVLHPSVEEMYPFGVPTLTTVSVAEISTPMEGASRPSHFAGVATVVAKLLAIAGPCRAYFGEKDWQQLAVIRRIAADLSFPVDVVGCPTVREADGLALSSRNAYLTADERAAAPALYRALQAGVSAVQNGERDPDRVRAAMHDVLRVTPRGEVDYLEVVDAGTLAPVEPLHGELRLLGAVRFGRARLIDNTGVTVPAPTTPGGTTHAPPHDEVEDPPRHGHRR
ncbi:MAG: pantoate--beta-alanine ligase [Acidimicrobiales bacterium]